jgi:F5/8 type C domain-containing protein
MSARPDTTEYIVIEFDRPQTISRLVYEVEETMRERTQEVRVEVSEDGGQSYRQVLVQEYNFSPGGATYQGEEQRFNFRQVTHLRLSIVPNKSGGDAHDAPPLCVNCPGSRNFSVAAESLINVDGDSISISSLAVSDSPSRGVAATGPSSPATEKGRQHPGR